MLEFSIKTVLRDIKDNNNSLNFILPSFNLLTCPITEIENPKENFYFNYQERKELCTAKNKINDNNFNKDWDKSKKISNLYELIHISNNKMKNESISRYDPLSRSFFKLWEILNYFNLITTKNQITTAHLAEGPGGFVEACLHYRQRFIKIYPLLDKYYGITLNPFTKEIPGWNKANTLIKQFKKNIEIDYGIDNTGDLYKIKNIRSFSRKIKKTVPGADLITADGGFDFSTDFNKQEQMSHQLILAELLTAIKSQKQNGSLICKIFDSYSLITIQLLYFISCLYKEVYLVKPLTSRPANSEKYIVAISYKGFNTFDEEQYYICKLEEILEQWNNIKSKKFILKSIFENPPHIFFKRINEYNTHSFNQQKEYINKILELINKKPTWIELENIFYKQTEKAIEWCTKYNFSINIDSYFYQKYKFKYNNTQNHTQNQKQKNNDYLNQLDNYFEKYLGY